MNLIKAIDVRKSFGGVTALNNLSLEVKVKEILGIIGPNGAGKTTLLNIINGVYKPDSGKVYLQDVNLTNYKVYEIAQFGISRTFQIVRTFNRISVLENLLVPSTYLTIKAKEARDKAKKLLDFVDLLDKRNQYAVELSGGQRRLLEFARALMSDPKVVLMDEPFAGVHPEIKGQLLDNIKEMNRDQGKTFLIISHDVQSVTELCSRIVVLNSGEKLVEGTAKEILNNEEVIEAYLGE